MAQWQERLTQSDPTLHVYLMGIGGAGLSAIATVLLEMGIRVSGSDAVANPRTARLREQGVRIFTPQAAANLRTFAPAERPDVILMSSAIGAQNRERQTAESLGILLVKRAAFLPVLLKKRTLIAVAGTHGKSTTTAMIVKVLQEAGIDTGYIIGTDLPGYGNAKAGSSPYFVIEADEYDHMFLGLQPSAAVVTNVEWDHVDCYPTAQAFFSAFGRFTASVDARGVIISCADDAGAEALCRSTTNSAPWLRYGLAADAEIGAVTLEAKPGAGYSARLLKRQGESSVEIGSILLQVPGLHNLRNALAAVAIADWCGVAISRVTESLNSFRGTARRFEIKGEANGITVIDDYAHHPTEIAATLAAARSRYPSRPIWAIFQPHTFSRTAEMFEQMGSSFADADRALVTDIYAAREEDTGLIHAQDLVAASRHPAMQHVPTFDAAVAHLIDNVRSGDVVITLGAGDGYKIGEMLLEQLQRQEKKSYAS